MAVAYVPDWFEFTIFVDSTAKRWERQGDVTLVAEECFSACRDGKIRTRFPHTPLNECIPLELWNHGRLDGAPARISQVLVRREDVDAWWLAVEAAHRVINRVRGKFGPSPDVRNRLAAKMLNDLLSGRRSPEQLKSDTLLAMATEYGGSPNTAKEARRDALSRFFELQSFCSTEL